MNVTISHTGEYSLGTKELHLRSFTTDDMEWLTQVVQEDYSGTITAKNGYADVQVEEEADYIQITAILSQMAAEG